MAGTAAAIAAAKAAYAAQKRRSLVEVSHHSSKYAWVVQYEIESRELGLSCPINGGTLESPLERGRERRRSLNADADEAVGRHCCGSEEDWDRYAKLAAFVQQHIVSRTWFEVRVTAPRRAPVIICRGAVVAMRHLLIWGRRPSPCPSCCRRGGPRRVSAAAVSLFSRPPSATHRLPARAAPPFSLLGVRADHDHRGRRRDGRRRKLPARRPDRRGRAAARLDARADGRRRDGNEHNLLGRVHAQDRRARPRAARVLH